jgi:DNA topoisomerase VI subunit B
MIYDLLNIISNSLEKSDLKGIKNDFSGFLSKIDKQKGKVFVLDNGFNSVTKEFLEGEINQMLKTQTI